MVPVPPATDFVANLVMTPPMALCLIVPSPGLIGYVYIMLFDLLEYTFFIVSVVCPNSVLGADTTMVFLFIVSWKACSNV